MRELSGLRVLIVEDENLVALMIEDWLQDLGCEIVASVARFDEALKIATTAELDLAILDVNLDGEPVFPIAQLLRERRIPLVFSTGYGVGGLPPEFTGHPVLGKPFSTRELKNTIATALMAIDASGGSHKSGV